MTSMNITNWGAHCGLPKLSTDDVL